MSAWLLGDLVVLYVFNTLEKEAHYDWNQKQEPGEQQPQQSNSKNNYVNDYPKHPD